MQHHPFHLLRPQAAAGFAPARQLRDTDIKALVKEVYNANHGARKIWQELNRRATRWPAAPSNTSCASSASPVPFGAEG
ncbi:hypothetical protein ACWCQK_42005 [Streptomyces sp. NPDC002306]